MRQRDSSTFTSIKSEGALLPADFIQKIVRGDGVTDGLSPADYELTAEMRLTEAVAASWSRLLPLWKNFASGRAAAKPDDPGTAYTREKWLLPLLEELGYEPKTSKSVEIGGRFYPISHAHRAVPLHLLGFGIDLDKRTAGTAGAASANPHSLLQEFLNRSDKHLWGLVSNGLQLRLLRDSASITRQAYVEFDLAGCFEGESYADFQALWSLCHATRFGSEEPSQCIMERWVLLAKSQGTRALETLRNGVQHAIEALGRGFIAHPANKKIKDALRSGKISKDDYYRELLRLVYRLIFLAVAEDRGLMFGPAVKPPAKENYLSNYSFSRIRGMATRIRGTRHADLYETLKITMRTLGASEGSPVLGLVGFGSYLWSAEAMTNLGEAQISNSALLEAVRSLATVESRRTRRLVDFKNLGAEELGSVYESLLELHPQMVLEAGQFSLGSAAGHERKTTGSYYTPTGLIELLLDSALDPVLKEAARAKNPDVAILNLKVCDPACGSGHFLIAAAHRMAKKLAEVRSGDAEPSPEAVRTALRDVIARCIYGVDLNPMAVELCKVSLWLESIDPGKPLSFLDHHIKCGNSLIGATPAVLKKPLPDEAFDPIEGDDKKICSSLKKMNRQERQGQLDLFESGLKPSKYLQQMNRELKELETEGDLTMSDILKHEKRYYRLIDSPEYGRERLLADAWCAAFVWKKTADAPEALTTSKIRALAKDPDSMNPDTLGEVRRIAKSYKFFHWHLAFPDVFRPNEKSDKGWDGGFDVVLANPPWERVKLQEKEWFAERDPNIANARNASERGRLITRLIQQNPRLHDAFLEAKREAEGSSHLLRNTALYPLCGRGDINLYAIFAEMMRTKIADRGRVGAVLPSGIATDDTTKFFFQDAVATKSLVSLYDFENREGLFEGVHRSYKFCLFTVGSGRVALQESADFAFFLHQPADAKDLDRRFTLTAKDIALLNPNTKTCPIFRTKRDAEITKKIYERVPVLIKEGPPEENPWGIKFTRMFDMSNDSHLFRTREVLEGEGWKLEGNIFRKGKESYLPLYEAKMIHHYDHRWATYEGEVTVDVTVFQKQHMDFVCMPRYWVPFKDVHEACKGYSAQFITGYRWIARSTDERSFICTLMPLVASGNSLPIMMVDDEHRPYLHCLSANMSSYIFDYVARQKIGGANMTFGITSQLPSFTPSAYSNTCAWDKSITTADWLLGRVLELNYTSSDMKSWGEYVIKASAPFIWQDDRRSVIKAEIDAAFFIMHEIRREEVGYIMDTFTITRQKDIDQHGEYRTKTTILQIYDAMQSSIQTGKPFKSALNISTPSRSHKVPVDTRHV